MGDTETAKFVYKSDCHPEPDGTNEAFHVGDTLLVASSVKVYVDGVLKTLTTHYTLDAVSGVVTFTAGNIPAKETDVEVSYHYQWFTDDDLDAFLLAGANTLALETVEDETLVSALRPTTLHFACYFAYMKKSAETSDATNVEAESYQSEPKSFQNWKKMAENAWKAATDALKFYNDNVLNVGGIGMKIVSYRLPNYVPNS